MKEEFECYWGTFILKSDDTNMLPIIQVYRDREYIGNIIGLDLFTFDPETEFDKLEESIGELVNDDDTDE